MKAITRSLIATALVLAVAGVTEAGGCRQGWRDLDDCGHRDDGGHGRGRVDDGRGRGWGHGHHVQPGHNRPRPVPRSFYPKEVDLGYAAPSYHPYIPPSFVPPAFRVPPAPRKSRGR